MDKNIMCNGYWCSLADNCRRYEKEMPKTLSETYFVDDPYDPFTDTCVGFLPNPIILPNPFINIDKLEINS